MKLLQSRLPGASTRCQVQGWINPCALKSSNAGDKKHLWLQQLFPAVLIIHPHLLPAVIGDIEWGQGLPSYQRGWEISALIFQHQDVMVCKCTVAEYRRRLEPPGTLGWAMQKTHLPFCHHVTLEPAPDIHPAS